MRLLEIKPPKTDAEVVSTAALLLNECKPFLSQINFDVHTYRMWRGLSKVFPNSISIVKCPKNRYPRDTMTDIHDAANNYFQQEFGIKFRSDSFFVTGSEKEAAMYGLEAGGTEYMIFPRGPFQFCWSPVLNDFYQGTEEGLNWPDDFDPEEMDGDEVDAWYEQHVFEFCKHARYTSHQLQNAILSTHEIMVHCQTAYFLSADAFTLKMAAIGDLIRTAVKKAA